MKSMIRQKKGDFLIQVTA